MLRISHHKINLKSNKKTFFLKVFQAKAVKIEQGIVKAILEHEKI